MPPYPLWMRGPENIRQWMLGIGSVWINQFRGICGRPEIRRALSALGLPEDHNVWGCAALGYPAQPNETTRKQDAVAWF